MVFEWAGLLESKASSDLNNSEDWILRYIKNCVYFFTPQSPIILNQKRRYFKSGDWMGNLFIWTLFYSWYIHKYSILDIWSCKGSTRLFILCCVSIAKAYIRKVVIQARLVLNVVFVCSRRNNPASYTRRMAVLKGENLTWGGVTTFQSFSR